MSLVLRYAGLDGASTVDGPGVRTVLWFQGCSIRCSHCQNRTLWDEYGGKGGDPARLAQQMAEYNRLHAGGSHRYTITGGEPFDQQEELLMLVTALQEVDRAAHIIVYTGYTLERLTSAAHPGWRYRRLVLSNIDVLVDGPYKYDQDSDYMQYVGSANQRVIDMASTLDKIGVFAPLPTSDIVQIDWGSTGMFTIQSGAITAAKGWIEDANLGQAGANGTAPRCGESERG